MSIQASLREMEISDIVRIHYRPYGHDIGDTIQVVGYLSRKDLDNWKIYLSNTNPAYKNRRYLKLPWQGKQYSIKRIEYLSQLIPFGSEELYKKERNEKLERRAKGYL